ncbi:tetraspanin-1-like [Syngnathoides biaculeatus]|uniref:tetraspanin-1-like n=1 Tax=Syngnathoides biaculeatus TaxID=300417 RepID=UPI002ADE26A1|nr:tetraspanin-1-like [Syngnathoides biaculeatus]
MLPPCGCLGKLHNCDVKWRPGRELTISSSPYLHFVCETGETIKEQAEAFRCTLLPEPHESLQRSVKTSAKMCCASFLKLMMFIFNGTIFVAGAAVLGVGIWVKVDSSSFMGILDSVEALPPAVSQVTNVGYLLIGVGAVLLVIGFLGCCGAVKESRCMLLTFFSIVLIIFLIEVAGAVVVLVFKDLAGQIFDSLEEEVQKNLADKYGSDETLTSLWNTTMEGFQCCGYKNYTDFNGSPFQAQSGGFFYPSQCCNGTSIKDTCSRSAAELAAELKLVDGCFDKLLLLIEENAAIIAGVALGIAALEIAAMVVSMVLYKQIGNKA